MKIAIISINMYSKFLNFACPLHSFAFQEYLLKNGYDCQVLDYLPTYAESFDLLNPAASFKSSVEKLQGQLPLADSQRKAILTNSLVEAQSQLDLWSNPRYQQQREIRYKKFQSFIETRYHKTPHRYTSTQLEISDPGFDCYICATDVIWRYGEVTGFQIPFLLASTSMNNKWKLAYAASRGVSQYTDEAVRRQFYHYLDDIDYISVREESLQTELLNETQREISLVLDPVLLHQADFYEQILLPPQEENFVFLYYVMEKATETIRQAVAYAKLHHKKLIVVSESPDHHLRFEKENVDCSFKYDIGIEEWLGYLRHANCVFTNSFHGCCLSILFHQNLFVGHRDSDKVNLLLHRLHLTDRSITPEHDCTKEEFPAPDWERADEQLSILRQESEAFLMGALDTMQKQVKPHKPLSYYQADNVYNVIYHSNKTGDADADLVCHLPTEEYERSITQRGAIEYLRREPLPCSAPCPVVPKVFSLEGYTLTGWKVRIKVGKAWLYLTKEHTLVPSAEKKQHSLCCLSVSDPLPLISLNRFSFIVFEAVWKKEKKTQTFMQKLKRRIRKLF